MKFQINNQTTPQKKPMGPDVKDTSPICRVTLKKSSWQTICSNKKEQQPSGCRGPSSVDTPPQSSGANSAAQRPNFLISLKKRMVEVGNSMVLGVFFFFFFFFFFGFIVLLNIWHLQDQLSSLEANEKGNDFQLEQDPAVGKSSWHSVAVPCRMEWFCATVSMVRNQQVSG